VAVVGTTLADLRRSYRDSRNAYPILADEDYQQEEKQT